MSHSFFFLYWSYTGGTKVPIGNYPLNVMLTPSANPWESTGKPQGAHEIKTSPVFHPPSCIPFFFKSGFQELTCIPKTKNFKKRVFPFFLKPYFSSGLAFPKQNISEKGKSQADLGGQSQADFRCSHAFQNSAIQI